MTCNRIVVSNTSPVSNLAAVDRLDLLREVFGRVIVPQAVFVECTAAGAGQLVADRIRVQAWIETRDVADRALVTQLRRELDAGEAEAIALAIELKADRLLLHEWLGRAVTARFSLPVIGLLGVFVLAKQRGHIPAVKLVLDDLIGVAHFWIGADLYAHVLHTAGEA